MRCVALHCPQFPTHRFLYKPGPELMRQFNEEKERGHLSRALKFVFRNLCQMLNALETNAI